MTCLLTCELRYSSILTAMSSPAASLLFSSFHILSTRPCLFPLIVIELLAPNIAFPKITKGIWPLLTTGAGDHAFLLNGVVTSVMGLEALGTSLSSEGVLWKVVNRKFFGFCRPKLKNLLDELLALLLFTSFLASVLLCISILFLSIFFASIYQNVDAFR